MDSAIRAEIVAAAREVQRDPDFSESVGFALLWFVREGLVSRDELRRLLSDLGIAWGS